MHSFDYLAGWALFILGVWIAANGLDDLVLDLAVLHRWLTGRARRSTRAALLRLDPLPRIAILVPCWQESGVIARMLEHNLSAVDYPYFDFFVGAYPNDLATVRTVEAVQARHPRVHLALCPHDGPTNKADCLNWAMQHLMLHEETRGTAFDIVAVHDAEDMIHPSELRWLAAEMQDAEMVQVPVIALPTPWLNLTHGVYCDEFAESQAKDLQARTYLGGFLPSCGVGTGLTRAMVERLAQTGQNQIFQPGSLTEDYELGRRVQDLGGRQRMLPVRWERGQLMATREYFPRDFWPAVKQRTRWVTGIALQGWEANGWRGNWVRRYWWWRDRKGLLGNPLTALCNVFFLAGLLGWREPVQAMPFGSQPLIAAGLALQAHRLLMRMAYSARIYGPWFALGVPVRFVWGNVINLLCTVRAIYQFARAKWRREPLRWVKTAHAFPSRTALTQPKRPLGEILVDLGYVTRDQVRRSLQIKPRDIPLGEYLVRQGRLTDGQRWDALSMQSGCVPELDSPVGEAT
ncbi:MAG: glycosyl transferase family protein [Bryobacteraceae bacterium]|nr:glycosyl transferase family protein [Bryobacteraceae bacterium]